MAGKRRPQARARAEVLPFPGAGRRATALARWLPSSTSVVLGLVVLGLAACVYVAAWHTSLFAVRTIEVEGVDAPLARRIETALAPLVGTSLAGFASVDANRRIAAIPEIASARYDRDFPHTLRVFVRAERPVAVLRQGSQAWLVSAAARVLQPLPDRPYPPLPRIWIARSVDATVGSTLSGPPAAAVRAVAPLVRARLPVTVAVVRSTDEELTLVLRSHREVRLGDTTDLALKLAVARRLLPLVPDAAYVDVSVPERPVAGGADATSNPQLEG